MEDVVLTLTRTLHRFPPRCRPPLLRRADYAVRCRCLSFHLPQLPARHYFLHDRYPSTRIPASLLLVGVDCKVVGYSPRIYSLSLQEERGPWRQDCGRPQCGPSSLRPRLRFGLRFLETVTLCIHHRCLFQGCHYQGCHLLMA